MPKIIEGQLKADADMAMSSEQEVQTRFFVALLPPAEIQTYAETVIKALEQRYRTRTAQAPPHITLQPPFMGSQVTLPTLKSHLARFAQQHSGVSVQLLGFGAFAPRVLYINVLKTPELLQLQAALMTMLEVELGIVDPVSKQRPFAPHMTVASRNLTRQTFRQAWAELQTQSVEFEFIAEQLTLLIHNGQHWQVQSEFSFAERPEGC